MSYSWNSETRNLLYNLPVEAAQTFGLSTTDSIAAGGDSNPSTSNLPRKFLSPNEYLIDLAASKPEKVASGSIAVVSSRVETEEW